MRLAYIKKMDERVDPRHVCLYHGTTWKSSFHHIINKLRRDIGGEHIGQISRVICTCEICLETDGENVARGRQHSRAEINTMWEGVSQDDFATAQEYFEAYIEQQDPCEEFRGFLQSFYRRLQRANLLTDQDTSARRFLYVLHRALEHRDFRFLQQPQSRRERQNTFHTETVHLASLKPQDIGVCIGRRGNRIRHVVLPRCRISISVDQATNNVNATIKCPPKSVEDQKKKLLHHADVVGEARRQHERDVEEYKKDLARVQNDSNNDADDDDDDDDEFDDCN